MGTTGQNGFRLSLFGYDPALDHAELTVDEGNGPRVNTQDTDQSLALRKPLGKMGHDGGERFEQGRWQHRILRSWIANGARHDPQSAPYVDRLEVVPPEIQL